MTTQLEKKTNPTILFFIAPFLVGIGIDLYVPSLPSMSHYFATSAHNIQLTISFYMFGYALSPLFFGLLSDSIGRRKILLFCTISYTIISLLCAISTSPTMLIIARFLQGLSIAGISTMTRAIAVDLFSGMELKKTLSYFAISWALGPILGPFIGSYLQYLFNWRANFYFFVIYGLIILLYTLFLLPETNNHRSPLKLLTAYQTVQTLIASPKFLYPAICASLIYSVIIMFNIVGPFLIENVFHYSVITYGHIALSIGLAIFIGNICNRFTIQYFSSTRIIAITILSPLLISIFMLLYGLTAGTNIDIVITSVLLMNFSFGFSFTNLMTKSLSTFPTIAGTASAVFSIFLGICVFATTSISTLFKTNSQAPLATAYVIILTISMVLFILYQRKNSRLTQCNKIKCQMTRINSTC